MGSSVPVNTCHALPPNWLMCSTVPTKRVSKHWLAVCDMLGKDSGEDADEGWNGADPDNAMQRNQVWAYGTLRVAVIMGPSHFLPVPPFCSDLCTDHGKTVLALFTGVSVSCVLWPDGCSYTSLASPGLSMSCVPTVMPAALQESTTLSCWPMMVCTPLGMESMANWAYLWHRTRGRWRLQSGLSSSHPSRYAAVRCGV